MRIIEEYQSHDEVDEEVAEIIRIIESPVNSHPSTLNSRPLPLNPDRILVLDGAMGTMIQQYQLREEDFRGARFANHRLRPERL